MKREAIEGFRQPEYPRRDHVSDEEVLAALPSRWRADRRMAAGLSLLFAGVPAPAAADLAIPERRGGDTGKSDTPRPDGDKGRVALQRVFEHGEGRGAFGCVAVAPPAFLSESDARQIILEEFARVGVHFAIKAKTLPGVRRQKSEQQYEATGEGYRRKVVARDAGPLTIEGYDAAHNVGFEFVGESDYFELGGARSGSTVQDYDFVPLARRLADEAKRDGTVRLGVFYDPMARVEWEEGPDGHYREPRNLRGREQLRAQVRDFIALLKSEKVL